MMVSGVGGISAIRLKLLKIIGHVSGHYKSLAFCFVYFGKSNSNS